MVFFGAWRVLKRHGKMHFHVKFIENWDFLWIFHISMDFLCNYGCHATVPAVKPLWEKCNMIENWIKNRNELMAAVFQWRGRFLINFPCVYRFEKAVFSGKSSIYQNERHGKRRSMENCNNREPTGSSLDFDFWWIFHVMRQKRNPYQFLGRGSLYNHLMRCQVTLPIEFILAGRLTSLYTEK